MDAIDMRLALGHMGGLTAAQLSCALSALGSGAGPAPLEALFEASRTALAHIGARIRMPGAAHTALRSPDIARIRADREWLQRERVQLLDATDPAYPMRLAQIKDAPALLYLKGDLNALLAPQLAMVGSRHPTPPGRNTAREFAARLSRQGLTITSGLALGIDAASHEGALDSGGATIAVLGTGLDQIYPRGHRALAERIAASGALVTEFPPHTPPLKSNFPRRNRVISGLSLGLLVVEAARGSGSLISAQLAADQGREVFAIPGSIHNLLARGCHELIRGGAKLVEDSVDILEELRFNLPKQMLMRFEKDRWQASRRAVALDKHYKILLDALGFEPASLDLLADRTGLSSQYVASMLLKLELDGAVGIQAGGWYVRL
jgi:DNA processing protein